MKNRMKKLSMLFMAGVLYTGTLYTQTLPVTAEEQVEKETQSEAAHQEPQTAAETETAKEEIQSESTTQAPETGQSESSQAESGTQTESETAAQTQPETETEKNSETGTAAESETAEKTESGTEGETEGTSEESETEASSETEADKKEPVISLPQGEVLVPEKLQVPETLTVEADTYPVEYLQGVYKVRIPADTQTLQITIADPAEGEEILLTKWGGYLTEQEKTWYLCPDDPIEAAYTTEGNCYTADLAKFALNMEDITREQLAVYGELTEETGYAELLLTGEGRSYLLLAEYETEETENGGEEGIALLSETNEGIALLSASAQDVDKAYKAAGSNLASSAEVYTPNVSSMNGEWQILGLARSGQTVNEEVYTKYLANVISTLQEKDGVLSTKKYTEYSRVVLALTSLGVDVTNVAGYNLLQPLSDYDKTVWQGLNGAIWALIAFDSHDYEIPQAESGKTQNSREKLIQNILDQEVSGGGWDLSGNSADPDMTAMALQSLAPYYSTDSAVKAAVDRGVAKLSAIQRKNGSYATYGSETSESCSQVIVALTALGIDPNQDARFVKNGNSVVDALLTYANADGSFKHVLNGTANQMATEQAYYALTAYERFTGGKSRLYDMTDVALQSDKEKAAAVEKLIAAIPSSITLAEKTQIEAAQTMYNALNDTQKALVSNAAQLQTAAKKLAELEAAQKENGSGSGTGTGTGTGSGNKKPQGSTKKVNLVSGKTGGTSVGSTSSGKTSSQDSSEAESESETESEKKADKKGATKTDKNVTTLISRINTLVRTSKSADADEAEDQMDEILDIYRIYEGMNEEQQQLIEESRNYKTYQKLIENSKESNHYDEVTGTDVRANEEEILPWYIRLQSSALLVEESIAQTVKEALKGQGELLTYTDIHLVNLMEDAAWEPEDLVRVSIPMIDLGEYEHVAIVHMKEDGSMEFIEAHIAGENLEFDTDSFSKFGIVGYHGSMEELMTQKTTQPVWIYMVPGIGAAALLVLLFVIKLAMSGKKKGGKNSER